MPKGSLLGDPILGSASEFLVNFANGFKSTLSENPDSLCFREMTAWSGEELVFGPLKHTRLLDLLIQPGPSPPTPQSP